MTRLVLAAGVAALVSLTAACTSTGSVDSDAEVAIVTARDDDGLEIIRHSTAHLLAQAPGLEIDPHLRHLCGTAVGRRGADGCSLVAAAQRLRW